MSQGLEQPLARGLGARSDAAREQALVADAERWAGGTSAVSSPAAPMTSQLEALRAQRPSIEERAQDPAALDATLVLRLGYRGADFAGFAAQPTQRTVAGELTRAFETLLRRPVELTCAGRTDAGVHALAQYVSLPVSAAELERPARRLMHGLSALLPDDISAGELFVAPKGFSARFDALSRSYRYRIVSGQARPVLAWDHAWWLRSELDVAAMDEAAACLVGEHDFKSFCKATSAEGKPTQRCVMSLGVSREQECGEDVVCVDVVGNAFLHSMVRTIAGTLVEVGRGHRDTAWVEQALAACDRKAAGPCAPAKGLTFVGVDYPQELLTPWS